MELLRKATETNSKNISWLLFRLIHIIILSIPQTVFIHVFGCLFIVFDLFNIIIWLISFGCNVFLLLIDFGGFSWSDGDSVKLLDRILTVKGESNKQTLLRIVVCSFVVHLDFVDFNLLLAPCDLLLHPFCFYGKPFLDERHAHCQKSKAHGTVGDADKHLQFPKQAFLIAKKTLAGHHVTKPNRGESDEAEVGSRGPVPALPSVEYHSTHCQVANDGEDAQHNRYGDLIGWHISLLVQRLVSELPCAS